MKKEEPKIVIGIQAGDTKIVLTEEDAKKLYEKLHELFGKKVETQNPWYVPIPTWPVWPALPTWPSYPLYPANPPYWISTSTTSVDPYYVGDSTSVIVTTGTITTTNNDNNTYTIANPIVSSGNTVNIY
jgi:hypothetical protein